MSRYALYPLRTERDAAEIASRLLPLDWEECVHATGEDPGVVLKGLALEYNPTTGPAAYFVTRADTDEPIAAFGHHTIIYGEDNHKGSAFWMMASDAFRVCDGVALVRDFLDPMVRVICKRRQTRAVCYPWTGNHIHLRWLDYTGWIPTGRSIFVGYQEFEEREYKHVLPECV